MAGNKVEPESPRSREIPTPEFLAKERTFEDTIAEGKLNFRPPIVRPRPFKGKTPIMRNMEENNKIDPNTGEPFQDVIKRRSTEI